MSIKTVSQSQLGQDTAKNSQIVTTAVRLVNSGASTGPSISSIVVTDSGYNNLDDTAAATSNSYIRILGSNFTSTANVFLNGTMVPKDNVTFTSSTELRVVLPVSNTGNYAVGVFNSNSAGALYSSSFVISTMPQWLTGATLANTVANTAFSVSLSATSDSAVTYSNTTALPAGTTLAANGLFSGTITVGSETTYSFDVKATDAENQDTTRTFSVTVTVTTPTRLYIWGLNDSGQLGLNDTTTRSSPVQVGSGTTWLDLSGSGAYSGHTLATKTDGTLWTWGRNDAGQLGRNNTTYLSSPVQLGTNTNWAQLTAGDRNSMSIKTDGTLWGWGNNDNANLGLNDAFNRSSPVQVGSDTNWSKLSVSSSGPFGAAIKTDGTLWTWGTAFFGRLGTNNQINRSSPVQVGSDTNWSKISTSQYISSAAIKTDGTLWVWGYNGYGELGQNNQIHRSSPVQVGTLSNWSSVRFGVNSWIAIKTDGTLWACGSNDHGQLGINNIVYKSSPIQVGTSTNWSFISMSRQTSFAIKTDGTLWSWGQNIFGSLGANEVENFGRRSSPTQVGTGTDWTKIQGLGGQILAIKNS